ncbi:pyridoxamine 5'-phosphate oxidase family protein [Promicromonospora sp. NPDC090134]|uniref:pyridoxamine 5'-phosphate oxidase family protein n=1 Tax=Promicromonospora sp. NPDC090134 TaxID=3364408 RepID=UPI0037F33FB7
MIKQNLSADAGFHPGELDVQRKAGVQEDAARMSRMLEPVELSGGIAGFLADRTFLVITGRDPSGRLWTSPIVGPPGFLDVRSATTLAVHARIPAGDPLHGIPVGQKLGMTAVEFATRRRVRINGLVVASIDDLLEVEVEQAYGNCPQYIQQRLLTQDDGGRTSAQDVRRGTELSADDIDLIRSADTFFLGTVNPERGADASHRGGPPGFVRVDTDGLWWPDYKGNNLFNSFGNLAVDPEAALLFFDFPSGRTLHLSGTTQIEWGEVGRAGDDGRTGRIARFSLDRLVAGRALGAHETRHLAYPRNPALTD